MIQEFLISRNDGRCLYYLSQKKDVDPQLISGYIASLLIFMRTHHQRQLKAIIMSQGQWIIEYDPHEVFFIAASSYSRTAIDESLIREVLKDILQALVLMTGDRVVPLAESERETVWSIVDQTIRAKLKELVPGEEIDFYQPGILQVNI
jgi:hypothetical protein